MDNVEAMRLREEIIGAVREVAQAIDRSRISPEAIRDLTLGLQVIAGAIEELTEAVRAHE